MRPSRRVSRETVTAYPDHDPGYGLGEAITVPPPSSLDGATGVREEAMPNADDPLERERALKDAWLRAELKVKRLLGRPLGDPEYAAAVTELAAAKRAYDEHIASRSE